MNNEISDDQPGKKWAYEKSKARRYSERGPGLLILLIGILLLLKTADIIFFPKWFFSWPMLFLTIGLFMAISKGFRLGPWLILILVGALSLADRIDPTLNMDRYNWPIIFIVVGLMFVLRPKNKQWRKWKHGPHQFRKDNVDDATDHFHEDNIADRRDFVDVTSVFGGVKKNILTKNFKGGDILSFMGGSEIDMTQADFTGPVRIDVTNIFGGTKLVVPSSWDVQSDITAIFGGVDDKRQISGVNLDPNKVLILDGTCLFGGIEIRSF